MAEEDRSDGGEAEPTRLDRPLEGRLAAVDEAGDKSSPKTVVNVNDGDVGRAGIEHSEQRRDAVETGSIADAGRDGDDRHPDQSTDDGGEGAFHPGDTDDDPGRLKKLATAEDPVNPRDADVEEAFEAIAHQFDGQRRLIGDWDIGRSRGDNGDQAVPVDGQIALHGDGVTAFVKDGLGGEFPNPVEGLGGSPGHQQIAGSFEQSLRDSGDLIRGLALPKDDLGKALPDGAVMVDVGIAEVLKREVAQPGQGLFQVELPLAILCQKCCQSFFIHLDSLRVLASPAASPGHFCSIGSRPSPEHQES